MQNENMVGNGLFQMVKAAALALGVALFLTIIFAGILHSTPVADAWIYPVNQTIKIVAIAIGVSAFVRGEKGFIKGGIAALIFTALSYLTFAALGGHFSLGWVVLVEVLLTVGIGCVFGALAVNRKRN